MPRKARIDAPGALHHVIGRGIARCKIFQDDDDRENFLERLGSIVTDSGTQCYAWALIPNHFHLLLRTGGYPYSDGCWPGMRFPLTGGTGGSGTFSRIDTNPSFARKQP